MNRSLRTGVQIILLTCLMLTLWAATPSRANDATSVFSAAFELYQQGRYEGAISLFQRGLGLAPKDARAHYYLGDCLERVGRVGEAYKHYEKAEEFAPDSKEGLLAAGRLAEVRAKKESARTAATLAKAAESAPWVQYWAVPSDGVVAYADRTSWRIEGKQMIYWSLIEYEQGSVERIMTKFELDCEANKLRAIKRIVQMRDGSIRQADSSAEWAPARPHFIEALCDGGSPTIAKLANTRGKILALPPEFQRIRP